MIDGIIQKQIRWSTIMFLYISFLNRIGKFSFLLPIILLFSISISAQTATAPTGSGTEEDPYQIQSLENLYWITQNLSSWDKHFVQTDSIDASPTIAWDDSAGFEPIGGTSPWFLGSYKGNGLPISNLTISRNESYVGFFGHSQGTIDGVYLKQAYITNTSTSNSSYTGGIVGSTNSPINNSQVIGTVNGFRHTGGVIGQINSNGISDNLSFNGSVTGTVDVGGVVGLNLGDLSNSHSDGTVTGTRHTGGLVGTQYYGGTRDSYSNATVNGDDYAAGLIGSSRSYIINSYSTGDVNSTYDAAGFVGSNSGTITNCYTTSNVTAVRHATGLVYYNNAVISDSYATGNVTSNNGVATGFAYSSNNSNSRISNSYSTGQVSAKYASGFTYVNGGSISNSYSKNQISGSYYAMGFTSSNSGIISKSYVSGDVSGNNLATGFTRSNSGTISNVYTENEISSTGTSIGFVETNTGTIENALVTGTISGSSNYGFVSSNSDVATITNSFWDITTTGILTDGEGSSAIGGSSSFLVQDGTYSGWDFDSTWTFQATYVYPSLKNFPKNTLTPGIDSFKPTGGGSSGNPYLIANLNNLFWLSQTSSVWNKSFKQAADIDASNTIIWHDSLGFSPIGSSNSARFDGDYDGDGHIISDLTINRPDQQNVGLFGYLGQFFEIKNIGVTNVKIHGQAQVGGLVGFLGSGSVSDSYSSGEVSGIYYRVGGLVGYAANSTVASSHSTATVSAPSANDVGGLIGHATNITIEKSFARGDITGDYNVGGLMGSSPSNIVKNVYATGDAYASRLYAGGLFGQFGSQFTTADSLIHSYATGTATGQYLGGITGQNRGTIIDSYWDTEQSGLSSGIGFDYNSQNPIGVTTANMVTPSTFSDFDFDNIWVIQSRFTTPYLIGNEPDSISGFNLNAFSLEGSGTEADPYQINSFPNLVWLSEHESGWDKHYIQTVDINASASSSLNEGKGFSPIGSSSTDFTGSYDGKGYTISNLFINRTDTEYNGLFGYAFRSDLSNLTLSDVNITGGPYYTGALLGASDFSTIVNVNSSGSLNGQIAVGGLIGESRYDNVSFSSSSATVGGGSQVGGIIGGARSMVLSKSFSKGNATANTNYAGGLIGYASGSSIRTSFSASTVSASSNIGGLVGFQSNSNITNSYSFSKVNSGSFSGGVVGVNLTSTLSNIFWDTEKSTKANALGFDNNSQTATGITTSDFKKKSTFSSWSTDDSWVLPNGSFYPSIKGGSTFFGGPEITGTEGWRMFGTPFTNATFKTLTDSLWTQGFTGAKTTSGSSNIYLWDEPNQSWKAPDSLNQKLEAGQGFIMYVYEDDKYKESGVQGGFPKSILTSGTPNSFPQTIGLSYTTGDSTDFDGLNLVSNPTSKTLNWDNISRRYVRSNYFVWDAANNHFDTYSPYGSTNGGTKHIAPFQGFWVNSYYDNAPNITIDSTAIASVDTMALKQVTSTPILSTLLHIENNEGFSDEIRIVSLEDASSGFDSYDARAIGSLSNRFVKLSSDIDSNKLAIDARPQTETMVFDLTIDALNTSGNVSLSMPESTFPDSWSINLVNTLTGEQFNLKNGAAHLAVKEQKSKASASSAFLQSISNTKASTWQLVVKTSSTVAVDDESDLPKVFSLSQNYPNPFNPSTTINYQIPERSNVELRVFDILGREVANLVNEQMDAGYHQVQFDARHLATGMYIYRLTAGNHVFTKKLTLIK